MSYIRYPSNTAILEFPTFSDFPITASDGVFALAKDTDILYVYNSSLPGWVPIAGPGNILSVGTLDSQTPSANGAVIHLNQLIMQSASITDSGLVNLTTQSFAGDKTFTGNISALNLSGTNTGDVTLGTANGLSLSSQVLSLGLSSTSTTGALDSTDWNTFNSKQPALTFGNLTEATSNVLTIIGGTGAVIGSGTTIQVAAGVANGLATLDASGKVPVAQLPSVVMEYQGAWNPSTNTPTLSDATGTNGNVYWVSTAFAGPVSGLTDPSMVNFQVGDLTLYSAAAGKWQLSTPAAGVQSVNGAQGVVTVNAINQLTGDVTAGPASQSASKAATIASIQGTTVSGTSGTGNVVFSTSPTLVTPVLGAASGTSLNLSGLTISQPVVTDGSKNLASLSYAAFTSNLSQFGSSTQGVVPGSGGGTTNFLRADGSWAAPGAGTFTAPTVQTFLANPTGATNYSFTVTSANATVGATYTNNGQTFTVLQTLSAGTLLFCSGTGTPGASGTLTKASGTGDATITFSAFSGCYVTPSVKTPLYLKIRGVGGGAGGSGGGSAGAGGGTSGGSTIFGPATANGGSAGTSGTSPASNASEGGAGGSASITTSGTVIKLAALTGGQGGGAGFAGSGGVTAYGGMGGNSAFGGAGSGAGGYSAFNSGYAAAANTGSGGGGASMNAANYAAPGGGAGGYFELIMTSVPSYIAYSIGSGGAGGAGNTDNGGNGAAGQVIVEEYYQ